MIKCHRCVSYDPITKKCRIFQRIMKNKKDLQPRYIEAKKCVKNPDLCGPTFKYFLDKE
jgi:hypothetical protein